MPNELYNLKSRISEASETELQEMISGFRLEHFHLRVQAATSALDNPKRIRFVRKAIARCETALTERRNEGVA